MFRFAPKIPVKSIQQIKIKDDLIYIDGFALSRKEVKQLAINDGFDNVSDFHNYFNEDFIGKIIHWTDFKY